MPPVFFIIPPHLLTVNIDNFGFGWPKARGRMVKDSQGNFVIKSREGRQFIVCPTVGILWKLCNGTRSFDQIVESYKQHLGMTLGTEFVKENLHLTLLDLRSKGLLE
jgi:hypothetical protein